MAIAAGARFDRYEIVAPLGAGGMGEVYLAQDTRLDRQVALKLLLAQFTQDEEHVRRFIQEAKAASALNHPNIITIHEIGEVDGTHFIATEFIDGQTLRERMASDKLKLTATLDLAIQIASALSAAHEAGIIHRDIKPENAMVRRDGIVKVLDFGLAKLTERPASATDSEAPTVAKVTTDPGTVLGTVQYMSPEQARGQKVDARTDIFSLGVVTYEMVTGRAPFGGMTAADLIVSILEKEPAPLAQHAPSAPAELQRIVAKALRKEREERYQTVKDLLLDLKSLKQDLELEAKLASVRPSAASADGSAAGSSPHAAATATVTAAASSGEAGAAHTTSSAEYLISEIKRHKRGALLVLAALVVVIVGAAFGLYKLISRQPSKPAASLQAAKITPITTHGRAGAAAISPDGKYVAYAVVEDGKQSLWLRQVAISSSAPILPVAEGYYRNLTFSRDGNFLYYIVWNRDPALSGLYQITLLGRSQRRLMAGRFFGVTLSPDGARIALVHRGGREEGSRLVVADADGSHEQTLATRRRPRFFLGPPAWSPDGRIIACLAVELGRRPGLTAVSVEGGEEKPLFAHPLNLQIRSLAWLPDGSGLIVAASEAVEGNSQLWQISYPGGEKRKITYDLNDYDDVSMTADSSALVMMQESISLSLWMVPKGEASGATQIPYRTGKDDGQEGVAWTRDGKIVYTSTASGSSDLWIMDADGSNQRQLTMNAGQNSSPAVSPDGRYLVFASDRAGQNDIWRMNADGSDSKQLTTVGIYPQCSPDGKWVVYMRVDLSSGLAALWKAPIEGGTPVQLTDEDSHYPAISPDGKLIAYSYVGRPAKIKVIPFEGGSRSKTIDLPPNAAPGVAGLRWTPDGRALTYVIYAEGVSNLWSQPIDGGPPKRITDFKAEQQIFAFDWSRDGRLLLSRGSWRDDVVLISGFR